MSLVWHEHEEEKRNNIYRTYFLPSRNVKLQKVSKYGLFWVCHIPGALENWDEYRSRLRGPAAHVPQLSQGQEHIATAQAIGRAAAFLRPGHLLLVGRGTPPGAMQLRHKLGLMIVKLERTHDFGSSLFFGGGSR